MNNLHKFENKCCMAGMSEYPDNFFNLAICDPPYQDSNTAKNGEAIRKYYPDTDMPLSWNVKPPKPYFTELFRVSKNQIIWGGNHFGLPPTVCFIVWDKQVFLPPYTRCEYAWTSFTYRPRMFEFRPYTKKAHKIHPTQKPVELYTFLLKNYAKPNDLILDTHVGSASSLIACEKMGLPYVGYEKNQFFYNKSVNRIKVFRMQTDLFSNAE